MGWLGHGSSVTSQPLTQRLAGLPNVLGVGQAVSAPLLAGNALHQVCGVAGYHIFQFSLSTGEHYQNVVPILLGSKYIPNINIRLTNNIQNLPLSPSPNLSLPDHLS